MNLSPSTKGTILYCFAGSLLGILFSYTSWIFLFEPHAHPRMAQAYILANGLFTSIIFVTVAYRSASRHYANSVWYKRLLQFFLALCLGLVCYTLVDFVIDFIDPSMGLALHNKLNDVDRLLDRPVENDLLPIGYQTVYMQLFCLLFFTILLGISIAVGKLFRQMRAGTL